MSEGTIWSFIVTGVGLFGFILAGRKVWWAWYVNLGCQVLWFIFGLVTAQYGFLISALVYTIIFTQNAIKWTKERKKKSEKEREKIVEDFKNGLLTGNEGRALILKNATKKHPKKAKRPFLATEREAYEAYRKKP